MFGLYLVHGPVLHLFGYGLPHLIWAYTGQQSYMTLFLGLFLGWAISFATCAALATSFHHYIEPKCNQCILLVERWCFWTPA